MGIRSLSHVNESHYLRSNKQDCTFLRTIKITLYNDKDSETGNTWDDLGRAIAVENTILDKYGFKGSFFTVLMRVARVGIKR